MAACYAAMPSYTYAMKAEKLLRSRKFSCEVRRSEKSSEAGCGYSLFISGDCSGALEVLRKYSIPYTMLPGGGV
ncbi:MAG: DUF3343 domain-containing protein [Ruminococcus sp.]|nr:DUF3343 domain-containing protein [Ruminococcus sp.]